MEQPKVIYMSPEQAKEVDPSLVDSVTMTTGSIIKVLESGNSQTSNLEICEKCHLPKRPKNTTENVFRARKEEKEEEKIEEKEEIKVEGETLGTEEKKEVLRGPNGMPLLGDLISGKNLTNNDNINNNISANIPAQPIEKTQNQPVPITQPPNQIPPQRPMQPPQQIKPPVQYPQPPKQIIPPNQTPVQRPMMPQIKGPLNPSVRNFIPPKPRIIPHMPPGVAPVPPQPPKVVMPPYKMDNRRFIHPGVKHMSFGPQVFRNRKEIEEEVLCPECSKEVLCPECSKEKEVLCPDCAQKDLNKEALCPDCAKKNEKKEIVCPDCIKKEEEAKNKNEEEEEKNKEKIEEELKNKKREEELKKKKREEELKNKRKENEAKNKRRENEKDYKLKANQKVKTVEKKVEKKGKDFVSDNYKYHEINVKTSKNLKSQVIVKKDGVIIASHED